MAGSPSDDGAVGELSNGTASGGQSGESLEEWRSSEQVENGTPSTSPPYCDTDNEDDDDCEPKPSSLYGKFTWKIENFKQLTKRELRSNAFEVGGYEWYILIYPQGCDVHNHLSLFLCVANHDKLYPGWSHFAQFTIAVVNQDPKKSKFSDTLHRFWKKEHDWGWKKFIELSKVTSEGFIVAEALVIKAQVQVIREKDRPFRCLASQYRRELVRVYLTNVEQICRRFVEEKRGKIGKLIEDKLRWLSFCEYWSKVDKDARHHMSREKTSVILKVAVKHFFIEKEMTSTLVMDSLYSGLKALTQETPDPIVCVENDMFVLAGDVISLLVRASVEPLPPKDEKGPQNRTKDGNSGEELNKDATESDERRLKELGRRTVEIFVLSHIFSNKIEIAYQNAIALEKQEELIREEAQSKLEQRARGVVSEKEKRAKKKQSKQKRSSRKTKEKGKDEIFDVELQEKKQNAGSVDIDGRNGSTVNDVPVMHEMPDGQDDVSDVSFNGDDANERFQPYVEDRDTGSLNSDTDTSDSHQIDVAESQPVTEASSVRAYRVPVQNGQSGNSTNFVIDDSSSTCSTDSVPSVPISGSNRISSADPVPSAPMNGSNKGNSLPSHKIQILPNRGKKHYGKDRHVRTGCIPDLDNRISEPVTDVGCLRDASGTCGATDLELEANDLSMNNPIQRLQTQIDQKDEIAAQQKKLVDDQELISKKMAKASPSFSNHSRNHPLIVQPKSMSQSTAAASTAESSLKIRQPSEKKAPVISKLDVRRSTTLPEPVFTPKGKLTANAKPEMLMGSSAPLNLASRSNTPAVSLVQTTPLLSRSVSATGRLEIESSAATHGYAPSYKNAIIGRNPGGNPNVIVPSSSSSSLSSSRSYMQPPSTPLPSPISPAQRSEGNEQNLVRGFTFGSVNPEILQNPPQWLEYSQCNDATMFRNSSALNGIQKHDTCSPSSVSQAYFADLAPNVSTGAPKHQVKGALQEEFPHLDMINDLFDEEHTSGQASKASSVWSSYGGHDHPRPHSLNRHFTFPGEVAMSSDAGSFNYHRYDQLYDSQGSGIHLPYGGNFNSLNDGVSVMDQLIYGGNGHINGVTQSQWLYGSAPDLSLLNVRNNEGDDYMYQLPPPDYSNLVSGVNRYTSYHPANRH